MEDCISLYGAMVHSLARRFLGNAEDAEEAVQDAFTDIWRHAGRFDPAIASEKTMVMTIARRRLIDRQRRSHRAGKVVALAPGDEVETRDSGLAVDTADEVSRVAQMISQLRPEHRRALQLSVFEGWSHSRISKELGIPLGTIKTHIRRALLQVREMLQARGSLSEGVQA